MPTKQELTKKILEAIREYEATFDIDLYVALSELGSPKPKQNFIYSGVSFIEENIASKDKWNGVSLD